MTAFLKSYAAADDTHFGFHGRVASLLVQGTTGSCLTLTSRWSLRVCLLLTLSYFFEKIYMTKLSTLQSLSLLLPFIHLLGFLCLLLMEIVVISFLRK